MKKAILTVALITIGLFTVLTLTSFNYNTVTKENSSQLAVLNKRVPITFFTSATSAEASTYFGIVEASGGINKSGTYVMPTEVHGMALHCLLIITFPDGTITIRMNCNMKTGNGRWQVLEGTGVYAELEGNGPLVMPNETDEILTGTLRWK